MKSSSYPEIKEDNISEPSYEEEVYSKGLDREGTIEMQTRTVIFFYSRGLWNEFEDSLKALISILPHELRDDFKPLKHDVTNEGIEAHYQQFVKIQTTLETDTKMIFKRKFIKSYE